MRLSSTLRLSVARAPRPLRSRGARWGLAWIAGAAASSVLSFSDRASAESMDFALERLVTNPGCRTSAGMATGEVCQADDAAFKRLANQYGAAIAPSSMFPARTTGYGGFEIAVQGTFTTIDSEADEVRRGTRGSTDEETGAVSAVNDSPASLLQLYSLRIRKGFGFGIETGLEFGVLAQTSLIAGGADLRLTLLEGFREGVFGYLPDISAAGAVRTITGTPQMQLTVASVSGVMSKPITIAQSGELTPWVGYQYSWIFADSGVVDFTPATDALQACGYVGPEQPGVPGASGDATGEPVCSEGGSFDDFNNSQTFNPARIERQRLFVGMNYNYEILTVGGQFMFDVIPVSDAQAGSGADRDAEILEGSASQFTFAVQAGLVF